MNDRKDCPMRHENGNCLVVGGFCTSVKDLICEIVQHAYTNGYHDGIKTISYNPHYQKRMSD